MTVLQKLGHAVEDEETEIIWFSYTTVINVTLWLFTHPRLLIQILHNMIVDQDIMCVGDQCHTFISML